MKNVITFLKGFFFTWYFWGVMILIGGVTLYISDVVSNVYTIVLFSGFGVYLFFVFRKNIKEWNVRRKMPKGN